MNLINVSINRDLHNALRASARAQGVKLFELVEYILTKNKNVKIKKTIGEK